MSAKLEGATRVLQNRIHLFTNQMSYNNTLEEELEENVFSVRSLSAGTETMMGIPCALDMGG